MMRVLYLAFPLFLAACTAIEPHRIDIPSNKSAYMMKCSGMGRTLYSCYKKARELCPGGYNIIDPAPGVAALPMPVLEGTMMPPQHILTIECK